MITVKVRQKEPLWDESIDEFVTVPDTVLHFEHSLRAISKWEFKYRVPFLSHAMRPNEFLYYIKCMCVDENIPRGAFYLLTKEQLAAIKNYIEMEPTATWFSSDKENPTIKKSPKKRKEIITSELVYFWMSSFGIDWQAQDWHFARLMTLIRIASEKNKPPKKVPKSKAMSKQRALNKARRNKYHTNG